MANKTLQIRLDPKVRGLAEIEAVRKGFMKNNGEANLSGYMKYLLHRDLEELLDDLDGE